MKKLILGALALLYLTACSYRVYPVSTLNDNYNLAMQTPEEIAAKENVAIFLSENTPASIIALSDPTLKPNGENITGGLIEEEAGGPGLTKEQPHYNVWDDDWSK